MTHQIQGKYKNGSIFLDLHPFFAKTKNVFFPVFKAIHNLKRKDGVSDNSPILIVTTLLF